MNRGDFRLYPIDGPNIDAILRYSKCSLFLTILAKDEPILAFFSQEPYILTEKMTKVRN